MCKHIVQQKAQQTFQQKVWQKVHNNYVALLVEWFVFTKWNLSANDLNT